MNNDLISREALRKAIQDNGYSHYYEIFDIIDNAPTVEVENVITAHENIGYKKGFRDGYAQCVTDNERTGEWIATQVIGISEITLTCSNCKDEFIGENDIDTWKSVYHYCPSCGAYMGEDMRKGGVE